MSLDESTLSVLEATSRTFCIPIVRLPGGLMEAVGSAYLCMRAIDEVEDHPELNTACKASVLTSLSGTLQIPFTGGELARCLHPFRTLLPEVTLRLADWAALAPPEIAPRIWDATATMASRMAAWASSGWSIRTEADLDRYTFCAAGAVGLLLSDLWAWHDGTATNRVHAVAFGRGLQAVNILRNRAEDQARGVDFFPDGWSDAEMQTYARLNLDLADAYTQGLSAGPALEFCRVPLALARATLEAMARGEEKLSRRAVLDLVSEAAGD